MVDVHTMVMALAASKETIEMLGGVTESGFIIREWVKVSVSARHAKNK